MRCWVDHSATLRVENVEAIGNVCTFILADCLRRNDEQNLYAFENKTKEYHCLSICNQAGWCAAILNGAQEALENHTSKQL